ncbi:MULTISPECIES: malate dehydrogenase [unclassified Coleofasciculus]|uniref:malate dehydrogenase n=1 Tax=unclassified Coleofasciculus TaxID=2692782 RepID=UPI00187FBBE2|nr:MULTISPECIES: malate dehydrogenase [unclassified Coleofasciculus]MBE9127997.1 malate dehydrogenase [Coleofasciculus sp. LEGE 07081]MBE9151119.1 malate dehydrogenase [Coleofasciculus sp. LEGE 07092]
MVLSSDLPIACNDHRVTVIGSGHVGSTLAHRIAQKNLANVILLDILEGMPQGLALDLMQAQGLDYHNRSILGTNDYADTNNSDIVVITAGIPRKPGMSRSDLLKTNAKIVIDVAKKAIAQSPDALYIVVTNPLDVMTYLVWQTVGLPASRVMGMAGILDSARFQTFIAMELGVSVADVRALVLGSHGDLMVPLPRFSTVGGVPITELMDQATVEGLIQRTRNGGAEIVNLMKTGSAYCAPASSICIMVEAILHNQSRLLPVAAYLQGEYGLNDIFLGVPTLLGCRGIEKIVELELTEEEQAALDTSAKAVRQDLDQAKELL